MKQRSIVGVFVLAGLLAAIWFFTPARKVLSKASAAATGSQPIPVKETMTVEPGKIQTFGCEFPNTPGRLYGTFHVAGSSAKIKGATDDTLIAFKLIGPNNETLQKLDKPTSGNFDIHITSPGRYTFVLDNGGIIRRSARSVEIDAMYKPD